MCRLPLVVLALTGACMGGNYDPVVYDAGADAADQLARDQFETMAYPVFHAECATCHTTGMSSAPIWGETYDSINLYQMGLLLKCDPPEQSLILTKMAHPPGNDFFSQSSRNQVTAWVQIWATVHPRCAGLSTRAISGPFVPNLDQVNTVDLAPLGAGLDGANLTFTAQRVTGGLYLTSVRVTAGTGGLHVRVPRFEACLNALPVPDPSNAFSAVDLTIAPTQSALLPPGSISIADWRLGDSLSISFSEITPMGGAQGPAMNNGGSCEGGGGGPDGGLPADAATGP